MEKIKIYDIAKKLDISSKEVLQKAEELGIEAKSHLSNIDENDAKRIEDGLKKEKKQSSHIQRPVYRAIVAKIYLYTM